MEKQKRMLALMALWEKSGLSVEEFTEIQNMSLVTFNRWLKKYNQLQSMRSASETSFIEITPEPEPEEHAIYENERLAKIDIELPCGMRIKIY